MLLSPDGREQVLVPVEPHEAITDPQVSFDGAWVYYAKLHHANAHKGSDLYKIHLSSRRIVQLTQEGERIAAEYFERHAKDLEELMSPLSAREKQQVYGSLKKLGLLAAQKLGARQPVQERQ